MTQVECTRRPILLSWLRVKVTGASVEYVGSITIHEEMCKALGLAERELVQIRNERTGVELWTYVIYGEDSLSCPPGTLCLNGAAAHLVNVGDIVHISAYGNLTPLDASSFQSRSWDAVQNGYTDIVKTIGTPPDHWAADAVLEYASGKIHRPRITEIRTDVGMPSIRLDSSWCQQAGILHNQAAHIVNATTGQRDVLAVHYSAVNGGDCAIRLPAFGPHPTTGYGSRSGYNQGDVIIVMCYMQIQRELILRNQQPPMQLCFPFEKPSSETIMDSSTSLNSFSRKCLKHNDKIKGQMRMNNF